MEYSFWNREFTRSTLGTGSFISSTLETVQFVATQAGKVNLKLIATPITGCTPVQTNHQFDVTKPVLLSTAPVNAICEIATAQLSATASNHQNLTWSKVLGMEV